MRESSLRPSHATKLVQEGLRRYSVSHFLVALSVLIISYLFIDSLPYGQLIETALITLVLLSAVAAIGGRRRTLILASALVLPALLARWYDHFDPEPQPHGFTLISGLVCLAFVCFQLLRYILRAPRVDSQVLCAGIATFLLIALVWSSAYSLVARWVPGSFVFTAGNGSNRVMAHFEAVYFSFATLTGGCGDIVPGSRVAQWLVMIESTTGMLYVTLLIARLVGLYTTEKPGPKPGA
ncbi:MAG TPA: ion channel [Phycisphaerae bacterium]|nr:ion channel [Phycisphaerae bacterium]